MPNDNFIGFDIFGVKELTDKFSKLTPAMLDAGADEANDYLFKILRDTTYPRKKSVSRKDAYPHLSFVSPGGTTVYGYKSWKQFKLVMALWGSGKVPYARTSNAGFKGNWKIIGKGRNAIIANQTPYGGFLMGDNEQSSGARLIGWKMLGTIARERTKMVVKKFEVGMKKGAEKVGVKMK
jgi:hypothetical protein